MITKKFSIFLILLICITGTWMFFLKYSVETIEERIRYAKKTIQEEKKKKRILKAEWKTWITPEKIQKLAIKHLNMHSIDPKQLREFDASLFHNERKKYKYTKKLSNLVEEIFANQDTN